MDEFIQRVHDLPPEHFHDIRGRVFTFTPGIVKMNENSKPTAILQVNEASRAILVKKYYGETMAFELTGRAICTNGLGVSENRSTALTPIFGSK